MTRERYNLLMEDDSVDLTQAEISKGYHFCSEFDGLLVGPGMYELNHCSCWPKDHPVYKTAPPPEPPADNVIPF